MLLGGGSREDPEQSHSPHRTGHKIRGEKSGSETGVKRSAVDPDPLELVSLCRIRI
jgi:hypothetical protein